MLERIKILFVFCGLFSTVAAQSDYVVDNKVNSPYSRFGLGDLYSGSFGASDAMGGAAIGLPFSNSINTVNPATYSSLDTLTFILDFGFRSDLYKIKSANGENKTGNTNIDHFAIGYTISKWWGGSLGIVPFSKTGYNIARIGILPDSTDILLRTGQGEINRMYFGNAFDITKSLSIGVNASYLFGNIIKTKNLIFPDPSSNSYYENKETYNSGFLFDFGIQYKVKIKENKIVLGMVYQPESILNTKVFSSDSAKYPHKGVNGIWNVTDTLNVKTSIPQKLGFGATFLLKDKLLVAFDYKTQDWTQAIFAGEKDSSFTKSQMFNFGLQYSPNIKSSHSYFNKINYRLGGYYHLSHIKIDDVQVNDMGATIGFGLPFKNTHTMFNIALAAGKRGNITNRLVEENYIKINFNVSFYDFWFYKPKID